MPEIHTIEAHGRSYRIHDPGEGSIIGKCLAEGLPYEHGVLEHIYEDLEHVGTAVDVGAGIGNHTLWLSAICGYERVVAFEPLDFARLYENVLLNERLNIDAHAYACGDFNGLTEVTDAPAHVVGREHIEKGSVPVVKLDTAGAGAVDVSLLKIDVEGMEPEVLRGAKDLIYRNQPYIFAEAMDKAATNAIGDILTSYGYDYVRAWGATPLEEWHPR